MLVKKDVVNELDVPILCMGLKDVVVSASPEGILVSDKEQSSYIKPFVNTLDHRVMFAEKSWGSFKVIDIDKASMTMPDARRSWSTDSSKTAQRPRCAGRSQTAR